MFYNKVEICGVNTAKLRVLGDAEKHDLLMRVKEGDPDARQQLIDGNLRLVLSIVGRFSGRSENMDDLFQVGCIGLIKAIDNFNTELDVKFSTYAVPMIIGEVRRYLRDNNAIRVSRSVRDLAYRALGIRERLSQTMSREPTTDDILDEMKKTGEKHTAEEINRALEAIVEPISLFEPVYTDGSSDSLYVLDQIRDDSSTDENWLEDIALREALRKLSERERYIIQLRFYNGKTQMEIADEIGISRNIMPLGSLEVPFPRRTGEVIYIAEAFFAFSDTSM